MLKLEDIHVYRGKTHVLKGVSLEVGPGELIALIGANGAGKSTVLRTISGLLRPRQGKVLYTTAAQPGSRVQLDTQSVEQIVSLGVVHCPEGRQVFASLTVRENLLLGAFSRMPGKAIEDDYQQMTELFPILGERHNQAAGSLSGGEQMMLALGRALMARPRLLLLDEPSLGLAPLVVEKIFELLAALHADGMTILLVEQNAGMALDLAQRAYVLELGVVALSGSGSELAANDRVQHAYLGGRG
jgi:branched-chain amino acid transport system ATP-binding protein